MLSNEYSIPMASFGQYLRARFKVEGDSMEDRRILQDAGENLIEENPIRFLEDVISHSAHESMNLIFDGVRHVQIFDAIQECSLVCQSIYFEVPFTKRLQRFMIREAMLDKGSAKIEFEKINSHPVEAEIPFLKSKCHYILDTRESIQEDFTKLKEILR